MLNNTFSVADEILFNELPVEIKELALRVLAGKLRANQSRYFYSIDLAIKADLPLPS